MCRRAWIQRLLHDYCDRHTNAISSVWWKNEKWNDSKDRNFFLISSFVSFSVTLHKKLKWPKQSCTRSCVHLGHQLRLTFGCVAGYKKSLTLPKSSPLANRDASALRHTALISVPSAYSGQTPIVWNERLQFCVAHFKSIVCDVDVICRHSVGFPVKCHYSLHYLFIRMFGIKQNSKATIKATYSKALHNRPNCSVLFDYRPTNRYV